MTKIAAKKKRPAPAGTYDRFIIREIGLTPDQVAAFKRVAAKNATQVMAMTPRKWAGIRRKFAYGGNPIAADICMATFPRWFDSEPYKPEAKP